jgi:predicted Fe-Mo cluster-binding NifX family protein
MNEMKICITAQGPTLEAPIDPRFGRCANFVFVDPETMEFESVPNPGAMAGGGAGIRAAQFVVDQEAIAVLTGHVGPNAFNALTVGGVEIFLGASGSVKTAIDQFRQGQLPKAASPTGPAHMGMGGGRGRGRRGRDGQ